MIELTLLPQHLELAPGGIIRATVTLRGANPAPAAYELEVHGLEAGWYTLSRTGLTVTADAEAGAILTLHPPIEAARGVHPFELLATCLDDAEAGARVEAVLLVTAETDAAAPLLAPVAAGVLAYRRRTWLLAALLVLLIGAGVGAALAYKAHQRRPGSAASATATPARSHAGSATPGAATAGGGTRRSCAPTTPGPAPSATCTPVPGLTGFPSSSDQPAHARTTGTAVAGNQALPRVGTPRPGAGALPAVGGRGTPFSPLPALPDSPRLPGSIGPPSASPSPTGSPTETASITATPSNTATFTPTITTTFTPTATFTPTITPTPPPSATSIPTFTPPPTRSPRETATPAALSTASPTASQTAPPSPTAGEIAVRYGYDVTADHFVLKWQTDNAQGFTIDGQPEPLSGQQSFDLISHTYVLTATGVGGTQAKIAVVAVVLVDSCNVRVNSQPVLIPTSDCETQATPPTTVPSFTPAPTQTSIPTVPTATTVPSDTPIPTDTAVLYPTDTPVSTDTNTPFPTDTPPPTNTPVPTNTPLPTATATPIPSATASATFIPLPTLTLTPTSTLTAIPTATSPAPR